MKTVMNKKVCRKIEESYQHIKPYLDSHTTEQSELYDMCSKCELWCGKDHDYEECREKPCFIFWLAYFYLQWETSYE